MKPFTFSSDGRVLAAMDWDQIIAIWDVSSGKLVRELKLAQKQDATSVALNATGSLIAVLNDDDSLTLIRTADGKVVSETPLTDGPRAGPQAISSVRFDASDQKLVGLANQNRIMLWDAMKPESLQQLAVIVELIT